MLETYWWWENIKLNDFPLCSVTFVFWDVVNECLRKEITICDPEANHAQNHT